MRLANFRKKGKALKCRECSYIWIYRGEETSKRAFISCPDCKTHNILGQSLLPSRSAKPRPLVLNEYPSQAAYTPVPSFSIEVGRLEQN